MMNRTHWILLSLALVSPSLCEAQILDQPPVEACKPGDFTVIGYPDEFGPKETPSFDVRIDEKFQGNFLTRNRSWIPEILRTVSKWNGIDGATWNFRIDDVTSAPPSPIDGKLTIAACGADFGCPSSPPPAAPGGPGGGVIDFRATTLAVTLISQDSSIHKGIQDSDIFFNPAVPFNTNPTSGEIDFESVLLHELGHSLGLDHNDNCVVGRTVMESVIDLQEVRQELSSSELEGVRFLYPTGDEPSIRLWTRDQSLHFDAALGGFAPFGQDVHIYGHEGRRFTATASEPWVRVEPSTGLMDSQQEIEILVDQGGLEVGDYSATVSVSEEGMPGPAATIGVSLSVFHQVTESDFPDLGSWGVLNAANGQSHDFAPGSLVSLYGYQFSTETDSATAYPLPTTLAGVRVVLNGKLAHLLYVSPNQINLVIANDEEVGRGGVIVQNGLGQNRSVPIEISETAPELFLLGSGDAVAVNEDGTMNSAESPAAAGSFVTLYITGVGPVDQVVASGWPAPANPPAVSTLPYWTQIGGVVAETPFLGLAPGLTGVGQINVKVPEGVSGRVEVVVHVGDQSSSGFITVE